MSNKVTVNDLISMLNEVEDKTLPIKCIALLPENDEINYVQYSAELDNNHLIVDDDGDEVMLTMDFNK